jgi:hypothetical protein
MPTVMVDGRAATPAMCTGEKLNHHHQNFYQTVTLLALPLPGRTSQ